MTKENIKYDTTFKRIKTIMLNITASNFSHIVYQI